MKEEETKMKIEELKGDITYRGMCHDCSKQVEVDITLNEEGTITIEGGAVYEI